MAGLAVLAPVLGFIAVAGVLVQGHDLRQSTAAVAQEQARLVAHQVLLGGNDGNGLPAASGDSGLVQVVGPSGVVEASTALQGLAPLVRRPPVGVSTTTEVRDVVEGEEDRYVAAAVRVGDTASYVVAVRSLESVDAATASTTSLLAIGVPAVLALVSVLTWLLAGQALAPVENLRRRASEISVAGSGARLPDATGGDEIARLADTLNAMLGRLDASARSQRQFVADASHELRSPVAAIRTVMEVSATTPTDPDEVRADVLHETQRLEGLVDGLLALARRDALVATPAAHHSRINLTELVRQAAERPRRAAVATSLTDEVEVVGDRTALTQLVGCLLDNADRHALGRIDIALAADSTHARLTVTDDGEGVALEHHERIFERFVRLDEARTRDAGGAGLGLSIARAIAEEHDGTLRCVAPSADTDGATFVLDLPASA